MRLDDTLAAINAVVGCGQCGGDLGDSPSGDFCSEFCQKKWQRDQTANPDEVLGSERQPGQRTARPDVAVGRAAPQQESALPSIEVCNHCGDPVMWMRTRRTRIKVNAEPDPERGNIRWLPSEQMCTQFCPDTAQLVRERGFPLFVFHGLDCPETMQMSSRPRPRAERTASSASPTTRTRVMGQLMDQFGWRPGGSWRMRRGR